jgi:hypothetical protein
VFDAVLALIVIAVSQTPEQLLFSYHCRVSGTLAPLRAQAMARIREDLLLSSLAQRARWPHRATADGELLGLGFIVSAPALVARTRPNQGYLQYQLMVGPQDPYRAPSALRFVVVRALTAQRPEIIGRCHRLDLALQLLDDHWRQQAHNRWQLFDEAIPPLDRAAVVTAMQKLVASAPSS